MTLRQSRNAVERKIYFFRADVGVDEGGIPLAFDPLPALKIIDGLDFSDDGESRYQLDTDGNALCIVDPLVGRGQNVRFCLVRRTGLPQLEQGGRITDLNIALDSGLLEAVHIVFFPGAVPGTDIIGAEYNHFGPRISWLGGYLHEKSDGIIQFPKFRPLLRRDFSEQLERLQEIRILEMTIRPSFIEAVRRADRSLADAFEANATLVEEPETIAILAKPQKHRRQSLFQRLSGAFRFLLNHGESQQLEKFKIRGKCIDTGRVETIDFLKDQFISSKRIFRLNNRSRALDPNSAFQAIRDAHNDFREELESAASIGVEANI